MPDNFDIDNELNWDDPSFLEDDFNEDEITDIDPESEESPSEVRTAILTKNNMFALLCYKAGESGAAICRVDPRESVPAVQLYQDPTAARQWFARSLNTSKNNGWTLVYDGLPLVG